MRLFKTACTKPLSPDAKLVIRDGVRCAKYKVKGRLVEYPLTKNGNAVRIEADCWSLEFRDKSDIKRYMKAYTNKGASEDLKKGIKQYLLCNAPTEDRDVMQKWIAELPARERNKLIEFGMIDAENCAASSKSLDELVNEFESWMRTTKVPRHGYLRDLHYVQITCSNIRRIVKDCGFKWWSDIKLYKVEQYLGSMGLSKRTFNSYLMAIKQFCKWMVDNDQTDKSPIRKLKRLTLDDEPYRRVLTVEEFARFLDAATKAPYRYGMTGHERAVLYLLAAETGLRRGELQSLTVASFDFDDHAIVVEKINTKNRKGARQYLRQERIEPLKEFFKGKLPQVKAFNITNYSRSCDMIKNDLKETEIIGYDGEVIQEAIHFETKEGRFDFHSLRYVFSTAVGKTNATWPEHKFLMRHSTKEDLTAHYTKIPPERLCEIIEQLPKYQWPLPESMRLKATGTNDKTADTKNLRPAYV